MNLIPYAASALLACFAITGCASDNSGTPADNTLGVDTVANINGEPLYESVFRFYANNRTQKDANDLTDEERKLVLDELIQLVSLAQEARKANIDKERMVAVQIELQEINTLARSQINRYREQNAPTELELREEYDANLEELSGPQYKARHILVKTDEEAAAIIKDLQGGADFAEQAKQLSTGPSGPNGGDLGWFDAGNMVKPFADAVRTMEKGSITTEPVQTRFGWHVILLEDVREGQEPGLEAVRDQLTNSIMQRKVEAYVTGLREAATVVEPAPPTTE